MKVITIESNAFQRISEMLQNIYKQYKKRNAELNELAETSRCWVDNQEASALLKVSKRTLQNYRDKGIIGFSQIGKQIYYKLEDIEELFCRYYKKPFKKMKGPRYE